MVPHVVAAWLDEEKRAATSGVGVRKHIHALFFFFSERCQKYVLVCISSSYSSHVSKRLREEANRVPAKKQNVCKCVNVQG